jgi:hypothetical protein
LTDTMVAKRRVLLAIYNDNIRPQETFCNQAYRAGHRNPVAFKGELGLLAFYISLFDQVYGWFQLPPGNANYMQMLYIPIVICKNG